MLRSIRFALAPVLTLVLLPAVVFAQRASFTVGTATAAAGQKDDSARNARLAWNFRQTLYPSELARLGALAPRDAFSQQNNTGPRPG